MSLAKMTNVQLIELHNERADKPLKSWKRSKTDLVERIEALPKKPAADDKRAKYDAAIAAAAVSEHDAICVASEKLLTAVAFRHEGRKWGVPYPLVLEEIHRVFPDANTTTACLRWYVTQLNKNEGTVLPFRKRWKS